MLDSFHNVLGKQRETNIEVRESLLQSARMVGREVELKQLDTSLKLAFAEQGSVWLIGGETGVGKSRLTDELRIRALVRGALVVRGQSVAEASAPYNLWRDVLSRIILEIDLEPLEASVIKPIVPNIAKLLGVEDVPEAPEIGAVASYNRLVTVILDIFKRVNREVLIILEDLHWTREGLNLLKQLIPLTINNPLMIVGTYRSDERPDLPQELAGCQALELQHLSSSAVSAYTESVVGNNAGLPAIINLLQTETDGNVLFMLEFLRAIIEEFRLIDKFKPEKVPQDLLGGGVQGVIRYRLRKLPEVYRQMLQFAAVPGRVIDIAVMKKIYGDDTVEDWLGVGEEAMFLRVRNDKWRISNDTIRKTLLEDIEANQLVEYHRQAAETIESLYDEYAAAVRLSFHWAEAGNVTKEAYYKAIAAENAYDGSAFLEASEYFGRWLELYEQGQIQADKLTVARFHRRIGECYLEIGKISESLEAFIAAVETLSPSVPRSQMGQGMGMMGEMFRQTWHRFNPFNMVTQSEEKHAIISEAAAAMNQVAEVTLSYQPDPILSVYASLRVLNMSERIKIGYSRAYAYSGTALLTASIGQHGLARTYLKLANEALEHNLDKTTIAAMTFPMSIVYTGWGQWDTAINLIEKCLDNSDDVGDWRSWRQAFALGGDIDHYRGDYETATNKYLRAYTLTERMNHASQMAIQLAIRSRTLFMLGEYEQAVSIANNALALDDAPMASLNALPVHVLNALRLREWDDLQKHLDAISEKIANNPVKIYVQFDGYAAAAEARIALLAKQSTDETRQLAQSACKELSAFGKTYPIAEARAKIFDARRLFLMSEPDKASKLAQEGLHIAEKMQMPYDIGLAHMVLGRINSDNAHTQKAHEIFKAIKSEWGLHQLEHFDI